MNVYFLKSDSRPERLKIGKANDIKKRIAQLATGCPWDISLVGSIQCKSQAHSLETERVLHEIFAAVPRKGEWFEYTYLVKLAVAALLKPYPDLQECRLILASFKTKQQRRAEKNKISKDLRMAQREAMDNIREKVASAHRDMDREFGSIVG